MSGGRAAFRHLLAIACIAAPSSASARTIELAPGGDLAAAVRSLRSLPPGEDRVIALRTGVYRLPKTLRIGPHDSGTAAHPLVIRAAPGAQPVISGARPLGRLVWRPWRDGIWRAKISGLSFDQLWAGDTKLIRARYPDFKAGVRPYGGTAADATAPARVARWHDPAGGVIHGIHDKRWGSVDRIILGKRADGSLLLGPPLGNNRAGEPSETQRYVENIFEELDAPGEWYVDAKDGWLYLKPPAGLDLETARFAASHLENLIDIVGTPGARVHDVAISGIAFTRTAQTWQKTTEPLLRSDWKFHRGGAVLIEQAERVSITDNDLTDLGGNAVVVSGHARHIRITGNAIHGIGASAIAFVGRPDAVRSPLFQYHQSLPLDRIDRTPGPKSDDYPADSEAIDNLIHNIGEIEKQSAGVEIAMAARITVSHNSIYNVPRAGINIGDGTWGGHRITDNDVFDTVLETGDHGAFNAWGRDRYWMPDRTAMDRRVAANPSLVLLDAVEPIVLRHNRFQCDHGWDIDLDDGASNYVIEDNVLLSGGLKLREGFDRIARNNAIINNGIHMHVWFANSGDVIEHNILGTGYQPILMKHWGKRIDDNLFPTPAMLDRARADGTDQHSIAGDPSYIAPARGDYRVGAGSPALRIGFRNFATTGFGVTSPRLRAMARQPQFPKIIAVDTATPGATETMLGMMIKSIETLGEQSAAGLPSQSGVLVLSVAPRSAAAAAGLESGDAILAVVDEKSGASTPTPTALDLIAAYRGMRWRDHFTLEIMRNQARRRVPVAFNPGGSK